MKIDDNIAEVIINLDLFKDIHPNVITLFGIISNFYILGNLVYGSKKIANMFLVIRYLSDILDGAVARKYNKGTMIGGFLDSLNDIFIISMYNGIIYYILYSNLRYSILVSLFCFILGFMYLYANNSIIDHDNLKCRNTDNIFKNAVAIFIDNSILGYIFLYYINSIF